MAGRAKKDDGQIDVLKVERGEFDCFILGTSPLILNRMSEKAKRTILLPGPKKNGAEKASTLKHNPLEEFEASAYRTSDPKAPTLLLHLASAFKGAIKSAALDMPGTKKAQIGRLTYVQGEYISIYGIPKLLMSTVRSADINKTPDIRTRVIVPEWACMIRVSYVKPLLREQVVVNLLAAAGLYAGTGDWRPEKGSGNYGQFELVDADDKRHERLVKECGRAAQVKAMKAAEPHDDESSDLLQWFREEANRRGFKDAA